MMLAAAVLLTFLVIGTLVVPVVFAVVTVKGGVPADDVAVSFDGFLVI